MANDKFPRKLKDRLRKRSRVTLIVIVLFGVCIWAGLFCLQRYSTTDEMLRIPRLISNKAKKSYRATDHWIRGEAKVVKWLLDNPEHKAKLFRFGETEAERLEQDLIWDNLEAYEKLWFARGKEINDIEEKLISIYKRNVSPENSGLILVALEGVGTEKSIPFLAELLKSGQQYIDCRKRAAYTLGEIGGPLAFKHLCRIIQSPDEDMSLRVSTILSLWNINNPDAIPIIEEFLQQEKFEDSDRRMINMTLERLKAAENQDFQNQ